MAFGPWRPDDNGREGHDGPVARGVPIRPPGGPVALETASDRRRLAMRVRILEWGTYVLLFLLLLGFWQLQVVQGAYYERAANENQTRRTRVRPARGLIVDRMGRVLASNRASYEVALIREAIRDEGAVLAWLSTVLDEPVEVLQARLDAQRGARGFQPLVVASGVTPERVFRIEARRREYPGLLVQVAAQRYYPEGRTAAHVLGHVGEISPRQLEGWDERFRMGDIVGQQGVERVYNQDLFGQAGTKLAVVNNVGREVGVLEQDPPEPGETLVLTIDLDLQQRIEEIFAGARGAAVALDVNTGGILAMVSAPAFDPNAFATRFSAEGWEALTSDPALPLTNRALQAGLPPGSVFKLVMATAGLEEGVITPSTRYFCPGGKNLYGRFYRCLGEHGSIDVTNALAYSCNSFFYELGVKLGRERIVKWAERLGFGGLTGVDLPDEQRGVVPSDEWLRETGLPYYPGDTVSVAIGQGRLQVSPLQAAHMAAVVSSGFVRPPHLLARIEESSGVGGARVYSPVARPAEFTESTRQTVLRGMAGSVAYGSSGRARLRSVQVGGKTGTAQVASAERVAEDNADRPYELRNHAWFVAVAPVEQPEIALAVYLEHGGSGGRNAAPVGAHILAAYFDLPVEDVFFREIPPFAQPDPPAEPGTPGGVAAGDSVAVGGHDGEGAGR